MGREDRIDVLLAEKRQDIKTHYMERKGELSLEFVVEHDVKQSLWTHAEIRKIFPRYTEDQRILLRKDHIVTFTILIYGHWNVNAAQFRQHFLGRPGMTDEDLPFLEASLQMLPPDVAQRFWSDQFIFKPFKILQLSTPDVHTIAPNQRWPFLEDPVEIGEGGFGKVFKTKIAKHCFEDNRQGCMDNKLERSIAFKQFSGIKANAFRNEVRNLNYLRESLVKQDHIAVHLAAVKGKDNFFIFLDLAPLGDLEVLLNGGSKASTSFDSEQLGELKYNFQEQFPAPNMISFVTQLINLGGALDYIHKLPGNYAHMDLRPNNILVYELTSGKIGKWVLTDFGISSFRRGGTGRGVHGSLTIRDFTATVTSAGRQILEGTHRAPEIHSDAHHKENLDRQSCDIWSFACVANEVLAFMLGGLGSDKFDSTNARDNFWRFHQQRKDTSRYSDYWFEFKTAQQFSTRADKAELRSCILDWFEETREWISRELPQDLDWVMEFISVLRFALKADPAERPKAGAIVEQLRNVTEQMQPPRTSLPTTAKRTNGAAPSQQQKAASDRWSNQSVPTNRFHEKHTTATAEQSPTGNLEFSPSARKSVPRVPTNSALGKGLPRSSPQDQGLSKRKITFANEEWAAAHIQLNGRLNQTATEPINNARPQRILRTDSPTDHVRDGEQRRARARSNSTRIQTTTPESSTVTERPIMPDVPAINDSFQLPKNVEEFEMSPSGDKIVFAYPHEKLWTISILDLTQKDLNLKGILERGPPTDIRQSQPKIGIASAYVAAMRTSNGKKHRDLVNLDTKEIFDRPNWAQTTSNIVPSSSGCFAWTEHDSDSGWLVRIWRPENRVEFLHSLEGTIIKLWFNTVGTFLFAWTRQTQQNRIYTINADDPRAIPTFAVFDGNLQSMDRYAWGCQMRNACVVQEGPTESQYYIRSDLAIKISGRPDAERSYTAVCDSLMAILHIDAVMTWKGLKTVFRVVVRRFNFSGMSGTTRGRFESASEEFPVTDEPVQIKWHSHCKIAAEEKEDGSARIVVCNWKNCKGRIYTFEWSPN